MPEWFLIVGSFRIDRRFRTASCGKGIPGILQPLVLEQGRRLGVGTVHPESRRARNGRGTRPAFGLKNRRPLGRGPARAQCKRKSSPWVLEEASSWEHATRILARGSCA